ncbi:MAG: hypothetical protein JWM19_946 [Actinomycetia bacterium]|nr:hypothetical protein [Actinomycetes bacterium]
MTTKRITVPIDEDLLRLLVNYAKGNHRSLGAEAAVCIEAELERRIAGTARPERDGRVPASAVYPGYSGEGITGIARRGSGSAG